jgi:3-oxoadipate enol-lactonase
VPEDADPDAPFDWAMVAAIYRQRNDFDPAYWEVFPAITAPALVVAGGTASPIPQEEIARVARAIPDCRLVTVEAGHLVHDERPEEFAALVGEFLA